MLNLIHRIALRLSGHKPSGERSDAPTYGPVERMMQCDVNNLDRLARALAEPRRA